MQFAPAANLLGENGIIVIVVVALVLFGSTQIPKMARSLGSAQKEFKKGLEEGADDSESATPPRVEAAPLIIRMILPNPHGRLSRRPCEAQRRVPSAG